jgi:glycosyltransferase involved in cell wall biosynthesis
MRKQVIIFEDSSKVGFGGGQNITLQVTDVLSVEYDIIFVDFTSSSRYFKLVNEKYPYSKKVIFKSNVIKKIKNKFFQLINEALAFMIFKNSNIQSVLQNVNLDECIIYATTRRALIYSKKINEKFGIPYIYHAHLVEKRNSLQHRLIKNALRKAKCIICVSKAVEDSIQLKNSILLYNPAPEVKIAKKEKTKNRMVVASIGSLIPVKGFEYFIKAAAIFDKNANVEFRIYGEGEKKLKLLQMANGNKKLKMKGFCSNIIQELNDEIDIVVLSSIIEEALPTVIIEAKSLGIPVITTNIGGQSEIVEDGIDGFLVPIKNEKAIYESINKLICNIDIYNTIAQNSLISAQKFSRVEFEKNILRQISD